MIPSSWSSSKPKATVVVIDDSATALTIVSQWLEEEGHRVVPLARALGATSALLRVKPDILLLDIQMPGLSGDRLARLLSQSPATASIPIIFHSQLDPSELKRLACECAVVGAITKTTSRIAFMQQFCKLSAPFIGAMASEMSDSGRKSTDPTDTGIAEIDLHHRHVKRLSTRTAEMLRDNSGESGFLDVRDLRAAILELLVFMRFHLATEDRYLREGSFANIDEHRDRHRAYLDEANIIERKLELDLSITDLIECGRRIRLLALEHLWSTEQDTFLLRKRSSTQSPL